MKKSKKIGIVLMVILFSMLSMEYSQASCYRSKYLRSFAFYSDLYGYASAYPSPRSIGRTSYGYYGYAYCGFKRFHYPYSVANDRSTALVQCDGRWVNTTFHCSVVWGTQTVYTHRSFWKWRYYGNCCML